MVATIAPGYQEPDADVELINRVLNHPECTAGVASRFATHRSPAIRIRVAEFPGLLTPTLAILAADRDEAVKAAALTVLDERAARPSQWPPVRVASAGDPKPEVRKDARRL